jgi:TetR/AcrR family transcriptional regulator
MTSERDVTTVPKPRSYPRDKDATRQRLLRAARRVFMRKGYDLARVDEICDQARVNKRMLYVYFKDKEGLYLAILEAGFGDMLDRLKGVADNPGDPRADAEALVRTYFNFLAENSYFVRMVAWESLRHGRQAGRVLARTQRTALERLFAVFQRGVDQGAFRVDLDVRQLTASVYSLCLSHFAQRDFLTILSNRDSTSPEARDVALSHILRLVFDGIVNRGNARALLRTTA